MAKETIYNERSAIAPLQKGNAVWVRGIGNSMTPILKSGDVVYVYPLLDDLILMKNDIVLCKVRGNVYMHKITALRGQDRFQISNNHGHVNGWINRSAIYGYVAKDSIPYAHLYTAP